ncbi:PLC-like phosphodiesterase [Vararia minispora EC-137]|uniref:PLC-like phosphodiesterase n=1 Tax=Vararia minispora EC-137 TaxID=1314806 RepID=A0ACB8QRB6_9AGAM|nr:PLC-like phosphodiesterase [Vararia minispora EC-137]
MTSSLVRVAQVVLSFLVSSALAAGPLKRATTCNGFSQLCGRSFGNVTYVGAHDSYAVGVNNAAANQDYNITQQLADGVRMLQMQAHNKSGTIELCHSSCSLLDGGSLQDYLGTLKTWMDSNPNEVVSLLIVNSDGFSASEFGSVFQSAGLDKISYSPSAATLPASQWPTLGSMIDNGTRLVTFMDHHADFTSVPYIIDEFSNIWETAYDVTDTTFDCNVNRSTGDTSTSMYLINHFLDTQGLFGILTPNVGAANQTNAVSGTGSLGQQVQTCVASTGRNPNFMLVDYYEFGGGSVFQVAATANGVTYNPSTPIASPRSTSASSSSSSSSSSPSGSTSSSAPSVLLSGSTYATAFAMTAGLLMGAAAVF